MVEFETRTDKEVVPNEIQSAILVIARLRRQSRVGAIEEITISFPQLLTQRATMFFPDSKHLEIAKKIGESHSDIFDKRTNYCKEKGMQPPTKVISGEYFELNGRKFLKLDRRLPPPTEKSNLRRLMKHGFIILTPEFSIYSLKTTRKT